MTEILTGGPVPATALSGREEVAAATPGQQKTLLRVQHYLHRVPYGFHAFLGFLGGLKTLWKVGERWESVKKRS